MTADKAYDSEKVRQLAKDDSAAPVIPSRGNVVRKAWCPKRFYRRRHEVEGFCGTITDWRRVAARYEKLARNVFAATNIVAALQWTRL